MRVIAVDFDGTLCDSKWPGIGKPHWPIIHELIRRQADGDRIILWTCREGELLEEAVSWCLNHGLKFNAINSNVPERIEQYGDDPRKLSADEYWDDKAVLVSGGIVIRNSLHCVSAVPKSCEKCICAPSVFLPNSKQNALNLNEGNAAQREMTTKLRAEASGYRMQAWGATTVTYAGRTVWARIRIWLKTRFAKLRRGRT